MKTTNEKRTLIAMIMMAATALILTLAVGADTAVEEALDPILSFIKGLLPILLAFVGAIGALYCVILGVKFAKAEEPQDREKAKAHLKNAIIGFVLIFFLILALNLLMPVMTKWVTDNSGETEVVSAMLLR